MSLVVVEVAVPVVALREPRIVFKASLLLQVGSKHEHDFFALFLSFVEVAVIEVVEGLELSCRFSRGRDIGLEQSRDIDGLDLGRALNFLGECVSISGRAQQFRPGEPPLCIRFRINHRPQVGRHLPGTIGRVFGAALGIGLCLQFFPLTHQAFVCPLGISVLIYIGKLHVGVCAVSDQTDRVAILRDLIRVNDLLDNVDEDVNDVEVDRRGGVQFA